MSRCSTPTGRCWKENARETGPGDLAKRVGRLPAPHLVNARLRRRPIRPESCSASGRSALRPDYCRARICPDVDEVLGGTSAGNLGLAVVAARSIPRDLLGKMQLLGSSRPASKFTRDLLCGADIGTPRHCTLVEPAAGDSGGFGRVPRSRLHRWIRDVVAERASQQSDSDDYVRDAWRRHCVSVLRRSEPVGVSSLLGHLVGSGGGLHRPCRYGTRDPQPGLKGSRERGSCPQIAELSRHPGGQQRLCFCLIAPVSVSERRRTSGARPTHRWPLRASESGAFLATSGRSSRAGRAVCASSASTRGPTGQRAPGQRRFEQRSRSSSHTHGSGTVTKPPPERRFSGATRLTRRH